ncbi:MAG: LysR substrate-binding domain-containing protein [Pseudomonadota bacterium]
MDRLSGMEAFVAVVEEGSFSAAARKLEISRAVVGKRVAALEKELGAQLLNRTTRHVSTTGAGTEFYERARSIVSEFAVANQELSRNQSEPAGIVKIGVPMSFGQTHLTPMLLDFMQQYPKIIVHLTLSDRFVDVLAEGYDLVLRIGEMEDSSLIMRRIASLDRILYASPDYIEKTGSPSSPTDLTHHRILHYGYERTGLIWQLRSETDTANVEVGASFCANNGEVLLAAAVADHGIALLPRFIADPELERGRLVRVLPEYAASSVDLVALWPSNRLLPTRVRRLIDFLIAQLTGSKASNI